MTQSSPKYLISQKKTFQWEFLFLKQPIHFVILTGALASFNFKKICGPLFFQLKEYMWPFWMTRRAPTAQTQLSNLYKQTELPVLDIEPTTPNIMVYPQHWRRLVHIYFTKSWNPMYSPLLALVLHVDTQRVELPCTPFCSSVNRGSPSGTAIIDRLPQWCINRCNNWMIAPALVLFAGPYFLALSSTFFVMIDTLAIVQADAIIG